MQTNASYQRNELALNKAMSKNVYEKQSTEESE